MWSCLSCAAALGPTLLDLAESGQRQRGGAEMTLQAAASAYKDATWMYLSAHTTPSHQADCIASLGTLWCTPGCHHRAHHTGYTLVYTGYTFGAHRVHFGAHQVHFGTHQVHFGAHRVHFGARRVHFGTHQVHFGTHQVHFGTHRVHLWCTPGTLWCTPGTLWCTPGTLWCTPGTPLVHTRYTLVHTRYTLVHTGYTLVHAGYTFGAHQVHFGAHRVHFGTHRVHFGTHRVHFGAHQGATTGPTTPGLLRSFPSHLVVTPLPFTYKMSISKSTNKQTSAALRSRAAAHKNLLLAAAKLPHTSHSRPPQCLPPLH